MTSTGRSLSSTAPTSSASATAKGFAKVTPVLPSLSRILINLTNSVLFKSIIVYLIVINHFVSPSDDYRDLVRERCDEAAIPESFATCFPDQGRIFAYDPDLKHFDDARRWCRQKFGGYQSADLLSIETCQDWAKVPDIIKPFLKDQSATSSWIWTQIISGPRITKEGTIPEIVMEHLSGPLNHPGSPSSTADLRSSCLKSVLDTSDETNGGNILVLLVNGLSITPKLVHQTAGEKGHALCEYRFQPGLIPTSTPASEPTTVPAITEVSTIVIPEPTRPSDEDVRRNVDEFFDKIDDKLEKEEDLIKATSSVLENLSSEDFRLTTSNHINQTVGLAAKLQEKIDSTLEQVANKTAALVQRVNLTQRVCTVLSSLMDTKNERCWEDTEAREQPIYVTSVILTTEKVGLDLACKNDGTDVIHIDADTIQMEVFAFDNSQTYLNDQLIFPSRLKDSSSIAQIKFPSGIDLKTVSSASPCGRPSGLGTIYKKISNYMDPVDEKLNVASDLISFSFGESVNKLNVEVSLSHHAVRRKGDVPQCVFWDTANAVWNSTGCVYDPVASTRHRTVCHCTHLTNFAILMDISGRQADDQAKSILSLVCLTASVISLILTLFFLVTLPSVKSTPISNKRITITTNLCICLLFTDFILMFGVENTENILWCRIISATLFYCLAATFSWMLLEGYLLYQMIVVVPLNFEFRSRWLYLIGYGLAFIWLGITVSVLGTECFYDDTSYYCWISNPLYPNRIWFFAGPVALIIASNLVIYSKSIQIALLSNVKKKNWASRGTTSSRFDQKSSDPGLLRRWLKGSCSLMVLLGLTWIIGFLYFNEWSDWLSYVFIIINGSQGVFIFLFEIVTNSKARPAIIKMVSGKFPSTYISSVSKTSSSSNPISTLSTRSSRLFNQQSLNGKESSKGASIHSPTSLNDRKKSAETKTFSMELK